MSYTTTITGSDLSISLASTDQTVDLTKTGAQGASGLGITFREAWATATVYNLNDVVVTGGNSYICLVDHTSGTFATDLADSKWFLMVSATDLTTIQAEVDLNTAKVTYPSADSTKLAGIEALADVTDTTNVTAAGALMDSEVTNLAQVKAFDTTDYATAAQGITADAALPKAGGAMTGAITTNSTFDGRDVATDGTKLDSIASNSGFKPVAVTGLTPSLDVGSYTFFDNGTLTGDTTISFASVPTNAHWKYSYVVDTLTGAWDISTLRRVGDLYVAAEESGPEGIFFKPDGLKMYVAGDSGSKVSEYNLSAAWGVNTAVYSQSFSVSGQDTWPTDLFFKPDGLKMYIVGSTNDTVYQYTLSTAWDVSTASYDSVSFSVAAQDTSPKDVFFKPDGLKMYVAGYLNESVYEYNLSSAWNISTAVYSQQYYVGSVEWEPGAVSFKPDGLTMFVAGAGSDAVHEFTLSTAWNVTTATHVATTSVAQGSDNFVNGMFFKPDGNKLFILEWTHRVVRECNIGNPTAVTLPASVVGGLSSVVHNTRVTYEFATTDGGTTVNLISEEAISND